MNLLRSRLVCKWETLLTAEQINQWVSVGTANKLPDAPGVSRWIFASEGSERPRAYVGETENLRFRCSDYVKAAAPPVANASPVSFTRETSEAAIKTTVRVGEHIVRKNADPGVQLQRLRITEEGMVCGVEISERLLDDKVGRVLVEHWAILSTEREGYTMLNRNPSVQGKALRKAIHAPSRSKKGVS